MPYNFRHLEALSLESLGGLILEVGGLSSSFPCLYKCISMDRGPKYIARTPTNFQRKSIKTETPHQRRRPPSKYYQQDFSKTLIEPLFWGTGIRWLIFVCNNCYMVIANNSLQAMGFTFVSECLGIFTARQERLLTHHRPVADHLPLEMPQQLEHISQAQLQIRVS